MGIFLVYDPDNNMASAYMGHGCLRPVFAVIRQNFCRILTPTAFGERSNGMKQCSPATSTGPRARATIWIPPRTYRDLSSPIHILIGGTRGRPGRHGT